MCSISECLKFSEVKSNALFLSTFGVKIDVKNKRKRVSRMCENAYLSIKNPKASRALKWALDPGCRMLASLARLRFAMSATFGLRSWGPPLTKSWIRTCVWRLENMLGSVWISALRWVYPKNIDRGLGYIWQRNKEIYAHISTCRLFIHRQYRIWWAKNYLKIRTRIYDGA